MAFNQNDLFFSYKHVFRFILINQLFFFNTNQLPLIEKLIFTFKISNLVDLDDPRAFNYSYLFRFFFGRKANFTKTFCRFHLGVHYFSFSVHCFFFKHFDCFFPLAIFVNDILAKTTGQFLSSGLNFNGKFFSCFFSDMNIFIEKKTNIGFYNLKDSLSLVIFFKNFKFISSYLLVQMFKLFIKKHHFSFRDFF